MGIGLKLHKLNMNQTVKKVEIVFLTWIGADGKALTR